MRDREWKRREAAVKRSGNEFALLFIIKVVHHQSGAIRRVSCDKPAFLLIATHFYIPRDAFSFSAAVIQYKQLSKQAAFVFPRAP